MWITSFAAGAGLTMIDFDSGETRLPLVNLSVTVSAVLSPRLLKRATPPETVAVVVPWRGPARRSTSLRSRWCCRRDLEVVELIFFKSRAGSRTVDRWMRLRRVAD